MKRLSFISKMLLLAGVAFVFNACNKDKTVPTYDLSGDWKVTSFEDYVTSTVITKTDNNTWSQINNGDITVSFIKNDQTSGIISGIKVSNAFSGNYEIGPNGAITISDVIQTMINEPEWAKLFGLIEGAEKYGVINDQLKILCNHGKNGITLEKVNN